jgi:hypothetical protein
MIDAKSIRRALALTAALAASAAPVATARVADPSLPGGVVSTQVTHRGVPPRVDGIGVQPGHRNVAAVPITQPAHRHGFDWLSAAIAVAALASLTLLVLAGRSILTAARTAARRSAAP